MPISEHSSAYHLAQNSQLYEIQRDNNFEFVVPDLDNIIRAGMIGTESGAKIKNASEILRVSVSSAFVPHFTQGVISVQRGNTTIKYAGVMTFGEGSLVIDDFIGARSKDILRAWQALSGRPGSKDEVGLVSEYKKDAYLLEFTPDYKTLVRTWVLHGCWISGLTEGEYNHENNNKKQVTATIQYDWGEEDLSSEV